MPLRVSSRGAGLLALGLALACLRASPPPALLASTARPASGAIEPWPDLLPEAPAVNAPPLLVRALDGLRSGAAPWLMVVQSLRAELEGSPRTARAQLEALAGATPWGGDGRFLAVVPELTPGLHALEAGALRGTLAVSAAPEGGARFALGARGGAWNLVISARGRLDAPVAGGAVPAALEMVADVSWVVPGTSPERARSWSASLATAPGDPLRAPAAGARASGTLRVNVTAPDGAAGELALELAPGGLRARGRWPTGEDVSTADGVVRVDSPTIHLQLPSDGGPLTWRAVDLSHGRVIAVADGRADVGTWQDLAAEPPSAGLFHVLGGGVLLVSDHLGREQR